MLKFFRRGTTFIQGGTSIPESRVSSWLFVDYLPCCFLHTDLLKIKKKESVGLCYELCRDTENCAYFEYDSSASKLCHLHPTGITRGNGYPSVKCYKMEGELNQ